MSKIISTVVDFGDMRTNSHSDGLKGRGGGRWDESFRATHDELAKRGQG